MQELEFKFSLFRSSIGTNLYKNWEDILKSYFNKLYGAKIHILVENLKYINPDDISEFKCEYDGSLKGTEDVKNFVAEENYSLQLISPHKGCLRITGFINKNDYYKAFLNENIDASDDQTLTAFSFLIYGQNNCCGALSISATNIHPRLQNRKLATLLQYFKEDICRYQGASLVTCTDIYNKYYKEEIDGPIEDLKPYLPNTKVLLNTGWKVSKLFFNPNSVNVVGLFTKEIKSYTEIQKSLEVVMKIKLDTESLVKIEVDKATIGCDPELFLKSNETGEYVPSFFVMEGDKNNPTDISKDGHNIQCDNVMVEYGVPPSSNVEDFVKHNLFVQKYIKEEIADKNNLKMVIFPSARFEEQNLLDERARRFGCDPDYNAYTDKPNSVGNTNTNWRCAGGHIHVGYPNHNYYTNKSIIKAMDLFLSLPLVLMEPENKRKEMYGKAGAFRHQKHGVEYRVTSNYIFSSEELMRWAYEQTIKALHFVNNSEFKSYLSVFFGSVAKAIDDKDVNAAKNIIRKFESYGVSTPETVNKLIKS